MGNTTKSFARKLPTFTLIFFLITGVLAALALDLQLNSIVAQQQTHLGQVLASQLAKAVNNPMIHQDKLSLQVEVDEISNNEGVLSAAIYDATNHLLVESQHTNSIVGEKNLHTNPITIENAIAGYVRVQLDPHFFASQFKTLRLTFILLWLAIMSTLLFLSFKLGSQLSSRLGHIIQQLPGESANIDELSSLEQRVKPLLATRQKVDEPQPTDQQIKHYALLVMICKNLPRLESLVNQEHFESVMAQLDFLIDDAAALYGATRLSADRCSIHLEFTGQDTQSDHPLRALYCATAIQTLSKQLLDKQGIQLELASAISQSEYQLSASQILNECNHQEQVKTLHNLLEKAVHGEILLDKDTSEHAALEYINLSPLADDSPLFRVDKLHENGEKLVTQQLALLTRNL